MPNIDPIITAASRYGLTVRGGFAVDADDGVPVSAAEYLLLFGNAGSLMWDAFSRSDEYHDRRAHPLNRWSERVGCAMAGEFSGRALFPFGGPPHLPFLRWGKRAEGLRNSQLGMLIHPRFGLWHAYRFALVFAEPVEWSATVATTTVGESACRSCAAKPCLNPCPVGAFTASGYDVQSCFRYLQANPDCRCMTAGCQARVACPEGAGYRYDPPHAAFHMRAFVGAMDAKARRADSDAKDPYASI